jgi:hypothetical protein
MIASGTSANKVGGGEKVSEKATNRSWTFSIRVEGDSDGEIARGGDELADFLALAGSHPTTKLFLEVRGNSDVGHQPWWGQWGANLRYEIVHASPPQIWGFYTQGNSRAKAIHFRTTAIIKPYAIRLSQRMASAIGGVLEDTKGWANKLSRGTIIPETTTNKITNPIFGHGTYDNDWTAAANITASENTDGAFIWEGVSSVKLTATDTTNRRFTQNIDAGSVAEHTLSCRVKLEHGGAVSGTHCDLVVH